MRGVSGNRYPYRDPNRYPNLRLILSSKPINEELMYQQYDQMVKYATALRTGTAQTEDILRRFTRNNVQHPTYRSAWFTSTR